MIITILKSRGAYSAFSNSSWAHDTVSNDNEIFRKKETMDRVPRNHDVSSPTANHNIIARLDHAILLLPRCPRFFSHMDDTAIVEREGLAARMGGQSLIKLVIFQRIALHLNSRPARNLQVASCCGSERLKHIGIFRVKQHVLHVVRKTHSCRLLLVHVKKKHGLRVSVTSPIYRTRSWRLL